MVAQKCLVTLYNRERHLARQSFSDKDPYSYLKAIAMAELASYVEDTREPDIYVQYFVCQICQKCIQID